jgi:hypothetical protein
MDTVFRYWGLSLAAGLAVLGVVALLLEIVSRTAEQIHDGTAQIWRVGKLIANNTVHIALLARVNQNVAEISRTADSIAEATGRIHRAASGGIGREGQP